MLILNDYSHISDTDSAQNIFKGFFGHIFRVYSFYNRPGHEEIFGCFENKALSQEMEALSFILFGGGGQFLKRKCNISYHLLNTYYVPVTVPRIYMFYSF